MKFIKRKSRKVKSNIFFITFSVIGENTDESKVKKNHPLYLYRFDVCIRTNFVSG